MDETLTKYISRKTMRLKNTNACLSFVSTIWRDEPLLIIFNNLNNTIVDSCFNPTYQNGDFELLEKMVKDFLN